MGQTLNKIVRHNAKVDAVLSGDALEPYRAPVPASCWWCGSRGPLTHEHKFKKSDLNRMQNPSGLVWGGNEVRPVKSVRKSADVRFTASLCAKCNNEVSQPFDCAYQIFSDFVWGRSELWDSARIDWFEVYGQDWEYRTLDLARYIVKHLGCRLVHDGFSVPPSVVAFLDGVPTIADVALVLIKSEQHHQLYLTGVRDSINTEPPRV